MSGSRSARSGASIRAGTAGAGYIAVSYQAGHVVLLSLSSAYQGSMSGYKTQQHRLVRSGRSFHFVSYEAQPADVKRLQPETPASWYVMLAGKRWMVGPQLEELAPAELSHQFEEWLDAHVLGASPAVQSCQPALSVGAATLAGPAEALRSAIS
jgi:hypothetical protein